MFVTFFHNFCHVFFFFLGAVTCMDSSHRGVLLTGGSDRTVMLWKQQLWHCQCSLVTAFASLVFPFLLPTHFECTSVFDERRTWSSRRWKVSCSCLSAFLSCEYLLYLKIVNYHKVLIWHLFETLLVVVKVKSKYIPSMHFVPELYLFHSLYVW